MLEASLRQKTDSDFAQALLNCCLKVHYDILMEDDELVAQLKGLEQVSKNGFNSLEDLINHNICMVSHFTGVQINH